MNRKKILASVLSLALVFGSFAACGTSSEPGKKNGDELEESPDAFTIIDENLKTTKADVTAITAGVDKNGKVVDKEGIVDISGHKIYATGEKDNVGQNIYTTGKKASDGKIFYTKNTKDSFGKQIYYKGEYDKNGDLKLYNTNETPDYTSNNNAEPFKVVTTTTTTVGYKTTSNLEIKDAKLNYIKYFGGSAMDIFRAITSCKDGGYVAVSYSTSKNGSLDGVNKDTAGSVAAVKYSATGEQVWKYILGGDGEILAEDIAELKDGSIVIVGSTSATDTDAPLNCSAVSTIIIKLNKDGSLAWMYSFPGDKDQEGDYASSVAATPDGGFVVGGKSNSTAGFFNGGKQSTAYLFKFDKNCNIKWRKTLAGSKSNNFSGVCVAKNGDIFATCTTTSSDDDFAGLIKGKSYTKNTVLVKFSKNGEMKWSKNLDGSGNSELDSICATPDGGCVVAGSYTISKRADGIYSLSFGKSDGYVIRYDTDGNVCWAHNVGGSDNDYVTGVTALDNGFAVVGRTLSKDYTFQGYTHGGEEDGFVILLNENGEVCTVYLLDGTKGDSAMCATTLNDGSFAVGGYTKSNDNTLAGSNAGGQPMAFVANFSAVTEEKKAK